MHPIVVSQSAVVSATVLEAIRGGALFSDGVTLRRPKSKRVPPSKAATEDRLNQLYTTWFKVSQPIRFFVSGNIGNVLLFYFERISYFFLGHIDEWLSLGLPQFVTEYKDSVSFFLAYICLLPTQHLLNAMLVFGHDTIDTREKYLKTLFAQTNVYLFALCGSTVLNAMLMKTGMNKTLVFCLTLWIFACFNYVVINYLERRITGDAAPSPRKPTRKAGRNQPRAKKVAFISRGGGISQIDDGEEEPRSWSTLLSASVHDLVVATGSAIHVDKSILAL